MPYVRTTKTPAELSEARSRAAKMRKNCRGGRPAGSVKDPSAKAIPTRSLSIREPDYQVIRKFAFGKNVTIAEATHMLASALLKNHPDLKPEGWVD